MALGWCLILLTAGLLLLWLAQGGRAQSGLPQGRVIYADTGGWQRPERPLFSHELLLTGKPDYLVVDGDRVIPVEVKSGRAPVQPYPAHILQLAAYCRLVEECYGRRPPHGIIKYADHALEVDYTPELEGELLTILDDMQAVLAAEDAPRSHNNPGLCRACGYQPYCNERLSPEEK